MCDKTENRKCENCGLPMPRANFIPFNGGMVVCNSCCAEYERLGEPKTIAEYKAAIENRDDYKTDLIAKI